jgi:hypothetical protein
MYVLNAWLSFEMAKNSYSEVNNSFYNEINYQLDAIEYLFEFFHLEKFRAYMPIFRSNECYNFFTYVAYGVLV